MRFTDDQVFVAGSSYPRHRVKERFLKLVPYCCAHCGLGGTWNGKPIVLQLDHKNGVHNDHRRENLELVCPNCHSQTDTYAGRNSAGMREGTPKPNPRRDKQMSDLAKWETVRVQEEIKFGEWGWQVRASKYLGVTPQKVTKWITRVDPEFLRSVV